MSRLIDADALIADLDKGLWGKDWDKALAEAIINNAPTIDAVSVVRCKECKWRGEQTESGIPYYWCRLVGVGYEVPIEHFCSYGESEGK